MFGALIIWDHFLPLMGIHIFLVVVDYVTKWVEAIPTSSADHNTSIKMLKEVIFLRFGVPRYLMNDGVSVSKPADLG